MKIAVLSSFTIDLVPRKVDKLLIDYGLEAEWYVAPFNQYQQEILAADSPSRRFSPSVVIIAVNPVDVDASPSEFIRLLGIASREYGGATILACNFTCCIPSPMRFLEWNTGNSRRHRLARANCELADAARKLTNTYILDVESLLLRHGCEKMFDARYHYLAKMDYSAFGLEQISAQIATALSIIAGKRKKCLVVDLDNTLWGGILGEDGAEHIKLSNDGEGKAFHDFQQSILKLHDNGVILAICSKNDEAMALDLIENHPGMVLRKEHFAAWRINWDDKVTNIVSIANELNIGIDSFVFLDDSRHERDLVKAALPQVVVPDLPTDFSLYPACIADLPHFEAFAITPEDTERSRMYAHERSRNEIQRSASSLEEYFRSLQIRISVRQADPFTIPRIAQLTQKTNQFNLTTRRYTEGEIRALSGSPEWHIFSVSARDIIGDAGLVGVALIELQGKKARLDTFLMSCRVLGRGIEQAFLWAVLQEIRKAGVESVTGEYLPTGKNGVAGNFLESNGFFPADHALHYSLQDNPATLPDWIVVT